MILSAITAKLKRRSKDDFKGRHFEAGLIVQAVSWYLRYPLSYRDMSTPVALLQGSTRRAYCPRPRSSVRRRGRSSGVRAPAYG